MIAYIDLPMTVDRSRWPTRAGGGGPGGGARPRHLVIGTENVLPKNFLVTSIWGDLHPNAFPGGLIASLFSRKTSFDVGGGQEGGRLCPGSLVLTAC